MQRRGPLVLGSVAAQKSIRQPPVEVISDPLSDMENDPYEDVHKQLKVHQVFQYIFFNSVSNGTFESTRCHSCLTPHLASQYFSGACISLVISFQYHA